MIVSQKIPSDLEEVPNLILKVTDILREVLISDEVIAAVKLSLEEALVNAIKHGNKSNPNLFVGVKLKAKRERLIIEVSDQGEGFDFKKITDPARPENLTKTSGRGIFLIMNQMDKVEFFAGGSGIRMIKLLKEEKADENRTRET
jgi:serine/threonine-protein kinase RsbW